MSAAATSSRVSYARLSPSARAQIRWAFDGATIADYVRWSGWVDGDWHGDRCGCHDDRCIGYHHDEDEECGCLPVHLEQWWLETAAPVVYFVDVVCDPDCSLEWHQTWTLALGPFSRTTASQINNVWNRDGHAAAVREVQRGVA